MNIEDTRPNPVELREDENTIPTYYWSEIHSPTLNNLTVDILSNEIGLTQKVNIKGETPKFHPRQPAIVVYDTLFLRYKLLEVIAPIICDWKNSLLATDETAIAPTDSLEDLSGRLTEHLLAAIHSAVRHHNEAVAACEEIGISLPYEPKALLRSFKLAKSKNYRRVRPNSIEE